MTTDYEEACRILKAHAPPEVVPAADTQGVLLQLDNLLCGMPHDDEPIEEWWLKSIGFFWRDKDGYESLCLQGPLQTGRIYTGMPEWFLDYESDGSCGLVWYPDTGDERLAPIPGVMKTRGDMRRLLEGLQIKPEAPLETH